MKLIGSIVIIIFSHARWITNQHTRSHMATSVSDVNARSRTVVTPADQMDVAAAVMLAPEANGGATDSIDADQQSSLDRRPGGM